MKRNNQEAVRDTLPIVETSLNTHTTAEDVLHKKTVGRIQREKPEPNFSANSTDNSSQKLSGIKKRRFPTLDFFDIPKEFCKTPFHCQKRLRLIQKTFKKNAAPTLRATGLEVAAQYYLNKTDRRLSSALKRNIVDLGFFETVKEPIDWDLEPECIFCAAEASDRKLQMAFLSTNSTNDVMYKLGETKEMNDSPEQNELQPTDLTVGKKRTSNFGNAGLKDNKYNGNKNSRRLVSPVISNFFTTKSNDIPSKKTEAGNDDLHNKTVYISEVAGSRPLKKVRRTSIKIAKLNSGIVAAEKVNPKADAVTTDVDTVTTGVETILPSTDQKNKEKKEPVRELKRAASKDLTSALKQIINRHISEKTKAERKNEEGDPSNSNSYRNKRGRYRRWVFFMVR